MDAPSKYFFFNLEKKKKKGKKVSCMLCALREERFYLATQKYEQELVSYMKTYTRVGSMMGFGEYLFLKIDSNVRGGQCRAFGCIKPGGVA